MTTALWELQIAVYGKLTSDGAFLTLVNGVFDEVPEKTPMPYVVIGDTTEVPNDEHDGQGLTSTLTLHIWSRYRGYQEAARILAELDRVLDRQPLTVSGFTDVSIAREFHQSMRDTDPEVRHIPVRYRVWLTEIQEA